MVVLALVAGGVWFLTRSDSRPGELFVEAAAQTGPDPFTDSSAADVEVDTAKVTSTMAGSSGTVVNVSGDTAGLYGGTLHNSTCDREQQIEFLTANADKAKAFAQVLSITVSAIPAYLRKLTPVLLLSDTRVTNHGFANGQATARQSVLQAGTAVLVDEFGVPRVRCRCGNPLTEPTAISASATVTGTTWPGYGTGSPVAVTSAKQALESFSLVDIATGASFTRPAGTAGDDDATTEPPSTTNCAQQPDDAMSDLLSARRTNDPEAVAKCAEQTVVDYFFGLDDTFAASITTQACKPPAAIGLTSDADAACTLSTTAIILLSRRPEGYIATGVVLVSLPPSQACGSTPFTSTRPAEATLVRYFEALNDKDYATAFGVLSDDLQHNWASLGPSADGLTNFGQFYGDHLKCVTVTDVKLVDLHDPMVSASLGIQWYEVQFDAEYLSPLPAGSGKLQPYYKVQADPHEGAPPPRIIGEATG